MPPAKSSTKITERIPHAGVAYAYLELEASNAAEFSALREETLKKLPHYAFAQEAMKVSPTSGDPVEAGGASANAEGDGATQDGGATVEGQTAASTAAAPSAPTSESPREKALKRLRGEA